MAGLIMAGLLKRIGKRISFAGVPVSQIAERFDTPLYVISEKRIRENYRRIRKALSKHYSKVRIYYSAKANTNHSVLKILSEEGSHLDAVSTGEIYLAKKAGFPSEKILFTGTSVRNDELKYLLKAKVTINIDSLSQLERLLKIEVPKKLSFRLNPEVGAGHHDKCITAGKRAKFGLWEDEVIKGYREAFKKGVDHFGIHMHIGSGIMSVEPYLLAMKKLLKVAQKVQEKTDLLFDFVDIGGGLGIPYKPEDEVFDLELFAREACELYKKLIEDYDLGTPALCVEPGRYIVGDSSVLITRVNTIKRNPYKCYLGVDAGFNTLIRPAMYDSYHEVLVEKESEDEEVYDIAGPICESGDLLAKDRKLPKMEEGDLLIVLDVGAYGFSMSSKYNSRPLPAEVLINKKKVVLIRRRESFSDLMRGQTIAEWLK